MTVSRRDFIRTAGLAGAGLAITPGAHVEGAEGGAAQGGAAPLSLGDRSSQEAPESKRILILGGTGLIGPNMVRYAVERGHEVTIFNRGRTEANIPEVERLIGDRNDDLSALEGRSWDVVLDNNANDYRWVQRSTELLKDATDHYVYTSSISAYELEGFGYAAKDDVLWEWALDETAKTFEPGADFVQGEPAPFGLTKAISERTAHAAFPGRTTVVRPGLIVGPGDRSDRFSYWPFRIVEGGEILAPGNPQHANQIIDQRDLSEFIVRLAENGTTGDFNATGPASRLSMAEMLYGIRAITSVPLEFTWVDEDFLEANEVRPWGDLPSWIPGDPLMFISIERALNAGITYRPLAETCVDLLEWDRGRPEEARANRRSGMSRERERELLDAWHASRSTS